MNAKHRSLLFAFVLVCTLLAPLRSYAGPRYSVTVLPSPSSRLGYTAATAINDSGQVTGTIQSITDVAVIDDAFLYNNGNMQNLGNLGGTYLGFTGGGGYAINDSGQVAGASYVPDSSPGYLTHAFIYRNGSMQDIGGAFGAGTDSAISGINNSGQVTGTTDINGYADTYRAFLYSDGKVQYLGSLGGDFSVAQGINASGEVVGNSTLAGKTTTHAFLYSNGTMTDLGTLGGADSGASAINDSGEIVGSSLTSTGDNDVAHAFLYSNGVMKDLGTLGGTDSEAIAINDNGQVVGSSTTDRRGVGDPDRAFLYSSGQMINLNSWSEIGGAAQVNYTLLDAVGINDSGQIVVNGIVNKTGRNVAFVLTPLPQTVSEPGTLALLGMGLAGLGLTLCGRNRHA